MCPTYYMPSKARTARTAKRFPRKPHGARKASTRSVALRRLSRLPLWQKTALGLGTVATAYGLKKGRNLLRKRQYDKAYPDTNRYGPDDLGDVGLDRDVRLYGPENDGENKWHINRPSVLSGQANDDYDNVTRLLQRQAMAEALAGQAVEPTKNAADVALQIMQQGLAQKPWFPYAGEIMKRTEHNDNMPGPSNSGPGYFMSAGKPQKGNLQLITKPLLSRLHGEPNFQARFNDGSGRWMNTTK